MPEQLASIAREIAYITPDAVVEAIERQQALLAGPWSPMSEALQEERALYIELVEVHRSVLDAFAERTRVRVSRQRVDRGLLAKRLKRLHRMLRAHLDLAERHGALLFQLALELRDSPMLGQLTDTAPEYIAGIDRREGELQVTRNALRRAVDRIESEVDFQHTPSAARPIQPT
jgi:hypothetical protein